MVPLLEQLADNFKGKVEVVKFNCNKHNKELGVSLGIKVAPTFHLYRGEKQVRLSKVCCAKKIPKCQMLLKSICDQKFWVLQVAMMTGAKIDQLRELVEKNI